MRYTFTAVFSNGETLTRSTDREYAYAYYTTYRIPVQRYEPVERTFTDTGFSSRRELAERASHRYSHATSRRQYGSVCEIVFSEVVEVTSAPYTRSKAHENQTKG